MLNLSKIANIIQEHPGQLKQDAVGVHEQEAAAEIASHDNIKDNHKRNQGDRF